MKRELSIAGSNKEPSIKVEIALEMDSDGDAWLLANGERVLFICKSGRVGLPHSRPAACGLELDSSGRVVVLNTATPPDPRLAELLAAAKGLMVTCIPCRDVDKLKAAIAAFEATP